MEDNMTNYVHDRIDREREKERTTDLGFGRDDQENIKRFEKAGLTEDDALLNARMARILRKCEYDRTNNKVILWKDSKIIHEPNLWRTT